MASANDPAEFPLRRQRDHQALDEGPSVMGSHKQGYISIPYKQNYIEKYYHNYI